MAASMLAAMLLAGCNTAGVRDDDGTQLPGTGLDAISPHDVLIEPGPPPPDQAMSSDTALLVTIRQRVAARRHASGMLQLDTGAPLHADVWERLRAGLKFPALEHPRVQKEIDWYRKRPEYLQRVTDRARLYLAYIVDQVEARDMPAELALLPVVESAFQPYARSPAGATGMWQFIGPTGLHFGLRRSSWYDGRRDVVESTRAALEYLDYLHGFLEEDWLLAVAGYNAGEGNVKRAVRKNTAAGRPTDFFSLDLPAETEAYVPRLLAVVALITRPQDHGITLDPIDLQPYFEIVETPGQVDLAKAADMAGITLNELMLLNAGFMRHASDPRGPHRLLLPAESVPVFSAGLERDPNRLAVALRTHTVGDGETLSTIAARYSISVPALRESNSMNGSAIKVGQKLKVPAGFDQGQVASLSPEVREGMRRAAGDQKRTTYRVRNGDSLWLIARRHDTSVAKLKSWNQIGRRNLVRPGQRLVIWSSAKASAPRGTDRAPEPGGKMYVVKRGDSLWTIARAHGVSTEQLRLWNRLQRKTLIKPGQTLKVAFAKGETVSKATTSS